MTAFNKKAIHPDKLMEILHELDPTLIITINTNGDFDVSDISGKLVGVIDLSVEKYSNIKL